MISVALCTYNGEKYIEQQLISIINQTHKVDEIIVCDDGSTDNTIAIVNEIKSKYDIPIFIYQNTANIGVCANFEKAVKLCIGEIIFLSDQDDVWMPHKVASVLQWFEQNEDKSVVFTDAELIDENGNRIYKSHTLWDFTGFTPKIRKQFDKGYAFELIAAQNRCTGSTMALKKDGIFNFSGYCNNWVLHDEILAIDAILKGELGYIGKPLIQYRIHGRQVVGIDVVQGKECNMYSVNLKSKTYLQLCSVKYMQNRVNLVLLRAEVPKNALLHISRYFSVYGAQGICFLLHDIAHILKSKFNLIKVKR